jgi:hypothetical protein
MRRVLSEVAEVDVVDEANNSSLRRNSRIERTGRAIAVCLGAGAIAFVMLLAYAPGARAQTGAEYPRTIPNGGVPGGGYGPSMPGSGSISAPAPAGGGSSSTVLVPEGPSGDDEAPPSASAEAPPSPPTHHHAATHHYHAAGPDEYALLEPAEGHLKLVSDSWAYERPSKSSKRVEQMQAGKFVNVIGTSPNYVQVKLKSSEVAYVPLSAVQLVTPSDKLFELTTDAPVLRAPNHSARKLAEVHKGRSVHVVGLALNYMKIRMKDGTEGFIPVGALE